MMDRRLLDGSHREFGNRIQVITGRDPEMERLALDRIVRNYLATKARAFPTYRGGFEVEIEDQVDRLRRFRVYGWRAIVPTKHVVKQQRGPTWTFTIEDEIQTFADRIGAGVMSKADADTLDALVGPKSERGIECAVGLCGCVDPFAPGVIHSVNGPCREKCSCSLCAAKR